MNFKNSLLGILRLLMGWLMLWAFLDKLIGLGFSTTPEKSWLAGGSPTSGFLGNAVKGPFVDVYHAMAGSALVDWLFMLGLLLIGLALILGIGVKIAGYAGALMMLLMYMALLLPTNNPFADDHLVNLFVFLYLASSGSGEYLGFGNRWKKTAMVKNSPWLK